MNHLGIAYNILSAATSLPVAPLQMAQEQALPFVVFDATINPENTKERYTGLDVLTLIVGIYHNDLEDAQTEANQIRNQLTANRQTGVQSAWLLDSNYEYINEINAYALMQTYQLRVAYTPPAPPSGIGTMIIGSTFTIA